MCAMSIEVCVWGIGIDTYCMWELKEMIAISMGLFGVRNDTWDLLCVYLSLE